MRLSARHLIEAEYPLAGKDEMQTYGDHLDWKGKIVEMPVDKFLRMVPPLPVGRQSRLNIARLARHMAAGAKLDPPVLIVDAGAVVAHEGRHRAKAAQTLGITHIPVLVIPRDFPRVPKWEPQHHSAVETAEFEPQSYTTESQRPGGRDDIGKLPMPASGKAFARMKGLRSMVAPFSRNLYMKMSADLVNRGVTKGFKNRDAVGSVKRTF